MAPRSPQTLTFTMICRFSNREGRFPRADLLFAQSIFAKRLEPRRLRHGTPQLRTGVVYSEQVSSFDYELCRSIKLNIGIDMLSTWDVKEISPILANTMRAIPQAPFAVA